MSSLTIKAVMKQEGNNEAEIEVILVEWPAYAVDNTAIPTLAPYDIKHTIGIFDVERSGQVVSKILSRYQANVPSLALTERDIEEIRREFSSGAV